MIKLGQTVTCKLTGFTGVAYTRLTCLTGATQIGIMPRSVDNAFPSVFYVDEDRLLATATELAMLKGEDKSVEAE